MTPSLLQRPTRRRALAMRSYRRNKGEEKDKGSRIKQGFHTKVCGRFPSQQVFVYIVESLGLGRRSVGEMLAQS